MEKKRRQAGLSRGRYHPVRHRARAPREFSRVWESCQDWLILDSMPLTVEVEQVRIREVLSRAPVAQSMGFSVNSRHGAPIMTSLAALIGFCIANVPCSLYTASLLA